jgi:pyruvate dehydrogenase E2 component (dihydrolipoamide acetyltransferase)
MTKSFKMPDPGEGVHEVEIVEVHVKEGDAVSDGDNLFLVETDKAAVDIPAAFDGRIETVNVSDGDSVRVGDELLTYDTAEPGERQTEADSPARDEKTATASEPETAAAAPRERGERAARKPSADEAHSAVEDGEPIKAAPSTRRLARERGVDLADVEARGPKGQVLSEDVEAAAERDEEDAAEHRDEVEVEQAEPGTRRVPLRGVRRATAARMTRAWREIPHVTHEELVDITELEKLRQANKQQVVDAGGRLTVTVLAVKALAAALRDFPRFNASLDADNREVILKQGCHIGIAVDTDDGLLVPVLGDADRKSVLEIAIEARELAERARRRELERRELHGGTFTVTNTGGLGGTRFTPIINPPQAAILGIARAQLLPTVQIHGDQQSIEPRLMLPLLLSFDHRLNDGADAARFVNAIAAALTEPEAFLLRT